MVFVLGAIELTWLRRVQGALIATCSKEKACLENQTTSRDLITHSHISQRRSQTNQIKHFKGKTPNQTQTNHPSKTPAFSKPSVQAELLQICRTSRSRSKFQCLATPSDSRCAARSPHQKIINEAKQGPSNREVPKQHGFETSFFAVQPR